MEKQHTIHFEAIESYDHLDAMEKTLFDKAMQVRDIAYAPYSDFTVGCAILLENGEIITGSNQENAAYPSGLCAERTTIFYTGSNFPDVKIKKLFVIGAPRNATSSVPIPPCGACRQVMAEFFKQDLPVTLVAKDKSTVVMTVGELLPYSFTDLS